MSDLTPHAARSTAPPSLDLDAIGRLMATAPGPRVITLSREALEAAGRAARVARLGRDHPTLHPVLERAAVAAHEHVALAVVDAITHPAGPQTEDPVIAARRVFDCLDHSPAGAKSIQKLYPGLWQQLDRLRRAVEPGYADSDGGPW